MKLIEYMPQHLKNIREFQEIFKSEDEQLEYMNNLIAKMLTEIIVKTATSYGLERYEKIYNIKNISDDIDVRRFNILSKINNKVPFTLKWLDNKLKQLVGKDNYTINIDYNDYKITIGIAYLFGDIANTLKDDLRNQLPCNLIIQINVFSDCNLHTGCVVHEKEHIKLGVIR